MDGEQLFNAWGLDRGPVRQRWYDAPGPRERARWHARWLVGQGWTQAQVAQARARAAHTLGAWGAAFRPQGPAGLQETAQGGAPPLSPRTSTRR